MRQNVADYKLELKISVCMLVNFEFRILTWNWLSFDWIDRVLTEFQISILNYKFWFEISILILNFET